MSHIQMTAHFDVPVERVFELATDYRRYPEWNVNYTEIRDVLGGPRDVGTRINAVMRLLGRSMEGWAEVVEIEPPRFIKIKGTSSEGGGSTTVVYRLRAVDGGTEVTFDLDYELPSGMLGQVLDRLFVEKAVERDLRHSIENFRAFAGERVAVHA